MLLLLFGDFNEHEPLPLLGRGGEQLYLRGKEVVIPRPGQRRARTRIPPRRRGGGVRGRGLGGRGRRRSRCRRLSLYRSRRRQPVLLGFALLAPVVAAKEKEVRRVFHPLRASGAGPRSFQL